MSRMPRSGIGASLYIIGYWIRSRNITYSRRKQHMHLLVLEDAYILYVWVSIDLSFHLSFLFSVALIFVFYWFIQVVYLDFLDFGQELLPSIFPRIKVYSDFDCVEGHFYGKHPVSLFCTNFSFLFLDCYGDMV
jgi:hypothetical protein